MLTVTGPGSSSGGPTPRRLRPPGNEAAAAAARRRLRAGVLAVVAVDRIRHLARLFEPLPPAPWQVRAAEAAAAAAVAAAAAEAERVVQLAKIGRSTSAPVIVSKDGPTEPVPPSLTGSLGASRRRPSGTNLDVGVLGKVRGEDDDELLAAFSSCECALG